jgi:GT2 family glycosyltransferase
MQRSAAPAGEHAAQVPDLPVLDLLSSAPVPAAAAPLLVTAHGHPLGFVPEDQADPRAYAELAYADQLAAHRAEQAPCSWQAALGDARPAATVVVTTIGDRFEPLNAVLAELLQQTYSPLEVLVVDNRPGTWDRSPVLTDPRIRVVEEHTRGVSAARNGALAACTTPVVLYLDDDVLPSRDWAGWLVAALHTTPDTACATGLILPLDTTSRSAQLIEQWGGFGKGFDPTLHQHPHPEPPSALYPYEPGIYGSGACVGFWTDALRALGGYDEVLGAGTPAHGGEDLAVQMSVVLGGKHLVYEPRAMIWHHHRASEQEWTRQLFWYGAGLSATMTRRMLTSPRDFLGILRRLPVAAKHAVAKDSTRNAARSSDYPRKLVLVELLGMLVGPWALVRSIAWRRRVR